MLNVRFESNEIPNSIDILDISGKLVMKLDNQGQSFDISHLPKGSYLLKADLGGSIHTEKIILE
jgi:hypothetical protein